MLKKVAIAAAAVTAGLLALAPLALADDVDIDGEQVCSNEVTATPPDPFAMLTGPTNGNIGSCETFSFVFPPE